MIYKILVITSYITFSLTAMENAALTLYNITHPESKSLTQYNIDDVYKKMCNTFNSYNPTNIDHINGVINIIAKIKILNNNQIKTTDIGKFVYTQEESFPAKILSPQYNSHLYMSIILERINQYNRQLTKNKFTSPTIEEFKQYIENEESKRIIDPAADCSIYLDLQAILHVIPSTVAINELEKLLHDIVKIQKIPSETINIMAKRIYNSNVQKEHQK